uniref:Uncharacterized protein n=1 Tax=Oryza glumipatula TaxID=40148 RepID=A0A0E0B3Q8_9ORYZ
MAAARLQPRRRGRLGAKGWHGASERPRRQRGEEQRIRRRHHRIRRPASTTRRVAAGSGVSTAGSEPWWCGSTADAATPMARRPWLAGNGEAATAEIVPASWRLVAGLSWAAVVLVVVVTASWWFKAAGMTSAEGAKAAVLVPARR